MATEKPQEFSLVAESEQDPCAGWAEADLKQNGLTKVKSILTAPTFLSGMILTFWTWPVVSKICLSTSSVTRGSSPPTYNARLFGSGAARRTKPPALPGDIIPPDIGDVMAVGIGFVFCGMTTGGRGGGGMWAGLP